MHHVYESPVGKVLFIIKDNHSYHEEFKKGKDFLFKGTEKECERYCALSKPDHSIHYVN